MSLPKTGSSAKNLSRKMRHNAKEATVVERLLGEGMDDADDGEHLEVTGPGEVTNEAAKIADDIEQAAERLSGLIDRRANANNPKLTRNLKQIYYALSEVVEQVDQSSMST